MVSGLALEVLRLSSAPQAGMRNHPHTVVSSFLHSQVGQLHMRYYTHLSTGIYFSLALSPAVRRPSILINAPIHRLDIISRVAFRHNPSPLLRLHLPPKNPLPIPPSSAPAAHTSTRSHHQRLPYPLLYAWVNTNTATSDEATVVVTML
jgi:hypothetical protein